jgi:hypothetical protein
MPCAARLFAVVHTGFTPLRKWGEQLPRGYRVFTSNVDAWLNTVRRPLVIEIGAGTAIPSVRHFSLRIIHEYGGRLIRVNPREFAVPTSYDVGLNIGALAALSAIADRLDRRK